MANDWQECVLSLTEQTRIRGENYRHLLTYPNCNEHFASNLHSREKIFYLIPCDSKWVRCYSREREKNRTVRMQEVCVFWKAWKKTSKTKSPIMSIKQFASDKTSLLISTFFYD